MLRDARQKARLWVLLAAAGLAACLPLGQGGGLQSPAAPEASAPTSAPATVKPDATGVPPSASPRPADPGGTRVPLPSDPPLILTSTPLPTASLTPTATPDFSSYFSPTAGSKLGLHFIYNTPASYQFLLDTQPPVIKLVDDLSWVEQVRRDLPETVIIARLSGQDLGLTRLDPIRAATHYVQDQLAVYRAHPAVDYWEGFNEWDPQTPEEWDWYSQFEAQRACLMQHYRMRAVIGNFATGQPEFTEMLLFIPAVRIGLQCGAILGLHEYSAPTLDFGYGMRIPRRPTFSDRGILTFRYRYFYEDVFKPLDLPIPLVITELGVDGGVGAERPGPRSTGGWLDFQDYWREQGLGDDGPLAYSNQLAWYDSEMRKDPYVIGATIFTAGRGEARWDSFNIERALPYLTDYIRRLEGR